MKTVCCVWDLYLSWSLVNGVGLLGDVLTVKVKYSVQKYDRTCIT